MRAFVHLRPSLFAVLALLLAARALPAVAAAPGALLIAGGAIREDNAALFHAFLARRPEGRPGIAIIAAASAEPAAALARTRELLVRHGADPATIRLVHLALLDDPTTPEDEKGWAGNATDPHEMSKIATAGAIWFTGGDQARIVEALKRPDGTDTPMLEALRAAHRQGAVVGGTSAGAAAMSNPMIRGGDPVAAVGGAGEALVLGPGLGFLDEGIADQHFDARYRLPRLLKALALRPEAGGIGYGVAEDTALIVEGDGLTAVGRGLVTIVDTRRAFANGQGFDGVSLRFLADGQSAVRPRAAAPRRPPHTRP
ncbi:cyanophycinase [Thermaurantiacus sp.]